MSDLDFTICCTVTFFSKKRRTPPNLNNGKYCPYLVIKGSEQLLGVNFIDGESYRKRSTTHQPYRVRYYI